MVVNVDKDGWVTKDNKVMVASKQEPKMMLRVKKKMKKNKLGGLCFGGARPKCTYNLYFQYKYENTTKGGFK